MSARQAGAVLAAMRRRGYDAWAGPTDPAVPRSNIVRLGFNGELHLEDFEWLTKYARHASLDLSFGVGRVRAVVLS